MSSEEAGSSEPVAVAASSSDKEAEGEMKSSFVAGDPRLSEVDPNAPAPQLAPTAQAAASSSSAAAGNAAPGSTPQSAKVTMDCIEAKWFYQQETWRPYVAAEGVQKPQFGGTLKVLEQKESLEGDVTPAYTLECKVGAGESKVKFKGTGLVDGNHFVVAKGPGKNHSVATLKTNQETGAVGGIWAHTGGERAVIFFGTKEGGPTVGIPGNWHGVTFFKPKKDKKLAKEKKKKKKKGGEQTAEPLVPKWIGNARVTQIADTVFNVDFFEAAGPEDPVPAVGSGVAPCKGGVLLEYERGSFGLYISDVTAKGPEQKPSPDMQEVVVYSLSADGITLTGQSATYGVAGLGQEALVRAVARQLAHYPKSIKLRVVKARGLANRDHFGTSDPYVCVQVIGANGHLINLAKGHGRTSVVKNSLDPIWNTHINLDLKEIAKVAAGTRATVFQVARGIRVSVFASHHLRGDGPMGSVDLNWAEVDGLSRLSAPLWHSLSEPNPNDPVGVTGELKFGLTLTGTDTFTPAETPATPAPDAAPAAQ